MKVEAPWDVYRAELGDECARSRIKQTKKPCTICGKPTAATSGICLSHELERAPR